MRRRLLLGLALVGMAGVAAVLFFLDPATTPWYPRCPFYALTGLFCPGCGSLRAAHHVLHGRLLMAFHLNPLAVLCAPWLAYAALSQTLGLMGGRALPFRVIPARWVWGLVVVMLSFWVVRNLPGTPWSWLAPPPGAQVRETEEGPHVLWAVWHRER